MIDPHVFNRFFCQVKENGIKVPSRHGDTIENTGPKTITFPAGALVSRPRIHYPLGWMELLQFVGGVFDPDAIKRIAPRANHELFTAQMAYGPRVLHQMPSVVQKLRQDPMTRQAIVFIGGEKDGPTDHQPCTVSMQFLIRYGVMRTVMTMRSWDLVKGMAYDVMMFGGMAQAVAQCVGVLPGAVHVTAGSPHIYVAEQDLVPQVTTEKFELDPEIGTEWTDMVAWARDQVKYEWTKIPAGITRRSS